LNSDSKVKGHIQRLFTGSESQDTITTDKTIEKWVKTSLNDLEKLGWIFYPDDSGDEQIEILPAFERIALIYHELINNIDNLESFIK
jgi:hypothetical protein